MRRLLASIALMIAAACTMPLAASAQNFNSMSSAELLASAGNIHPAGYFALAAKLFNEGRRDEAVEWLYIGQIRYRFHLSANPDLDPSGDPALLSSLMETVGRPINEYAGGDFDAWLRQIDNALAWDAANPNGFTSKQEHAAELERLRSGLAEFRTGLEAQRAQIESFRRLNGLPIR